MSFIGGETGFILKALDHSMAIAEFSPAGILINANANYLAIFDVELKDITGWHHDMFCREHDISTPEYNAFWQRLVQGETISGQFCRKHHNGQLIWLEASYTPVVNDHGALLKIIKFATDITARVLQANEQNMKLQALDRSMQIAEFTLDGDLITANNNFLHSFGYTLPEVAGVNHTFFCFEKDLASPSYQALWQTLRKGQFYTGLCERKNKDGHSIWLEATYNPVFEPDGTLRKIIKFSSDVSDRVRTEKLQSERVRLLSLVADETDNAVLLTDADWHIIYVNESFIRSFGYPLQEVLGKVPSELLVPEATEAEVAAMRSALLAGQSQRFEKLTYSKHSQRFWSSITVSPILDTQGKMTHTCCVLTDITEAKMHEVLQHKVLEAMVYEVPLADVMGKICHEVERISPEVIATILAVDEHDCLHPLAAPSLPDSYSKALEGVPIGPDVGSCGTAAFTGKAVLAEDIETDPLWQPYKHLVLPLGIKSCWSTPVKSSSGKVMGTFAFYYKEQRQPDQFHQRLVDVSVNLCALALEREVARAQIRKLAFYDSLTGLANRSLLHARADQAIASALRNKENLAVLFIDLDRFKQINDSLGHTAGDELLKTVANRLQEERRSSDIVGRLSGDEFVLVLPQCDVSQVTDIIEELQHKLFAVCNIEGTQLTPSASIGISLFPDNGHDMETLLHRADIAMYQAKTSGRGRFSFFSNEMNIVAQERLALEAALRDALKHNQLALHYQPQINMKTGRIYGVEALARWYHPTLGDISPARFIPLAEECGLIGELGHWAVREACKQLGEWRKREISVPMVSVNLSPTNFHNLNLPQMIMNALQENELSPTDLTLEITENVLLDTNPSTLKTLLEIHENGSRLAMDDFGSGYSSLNYLRKLPVSELKLDKSFVDDIEHDEACRALSYAALCIGESLQLTVIAEGVEKAGQHYILKDQGYHAAQGYLFSKPLPPLLLEEWLAEHKSQLFI
ncbi:bifunctional diguanylate cyclase/phosphodiesterase [Chromatiaceae bacterium AAb-1]|nr:bifunctional diguanylate cyclase/phosphodiesterase [Chromatiaceae bacterium AAb-1]